MTHALVEDSWKVSIVTPGKNYSGLVSCHEKGDKRTISVLNNDYKIYIKDCPNNDIPLNGFLHLNSVSVYQQGKKITEYDNCLIKKSEIIYAYDEFQKMGKESESKRILKHSPEKEIEIITTLIGNSTFVINGNIINFKNHYMRNQFIPISDAVIRNLKKSESHDDKSLLKFPFIALNKDYIGGYSFCNF